jgi:DNA primase large subunit
MRRTVALIPACRVKSDNYVDSRHARYPFFEAAQVAVRDADVSPASLITADAPAVDRGHERVKRALLSGTVNSETPRRWSTRTEVLSYPIARILVSVIDVPAAIDKYARAEAATARERLQTDITEYHDINQLQSTQRQSISFEAVLTEFGLDSSVYSAQSNEAPSVIEQRKELDSTLIQHTDTDSYWIELGAYLSLADREWGQSWRLTAREVTDGMVYVDVSDIFTLIESAIEDRVAAGLPFDVQGSDGGNVIVDALTDAVSDLRELVSDNSAADRVGAGVDFVAPSQFPPCMQTLVDKARSDEELANHAEFALVSFLVAMDSDVETILTILEYDQDNQDEKTDVAESVHTDTEETTTTTRERIETRVRYLNDRQGAGTQYPPPSCATMQAYGDCTDPDERCAEITDPVSYYIEAIDAVDNPSEYAGGHTDR